MSVIAIGDIHGCRQTLETLLERLPLSSAEELIFVGDYIDRGPDSKGVIDRLIALQEEYPCVFLRGNHEAMMLDYLGGSGYHLWVRNGGMQTLHSYDFNGQDSQIPDEHVAFVENTRLYYETPEFFFVHGGLKPQLSIEENKRQFGSDVFLWERSHLEHPSGAWEKTVVCGHTPMPDPVERDNLIALDTGCVYYRRPGMGRLAAVKLPEREFTFVDYQG